MLKQTLDWVQERFDFLHKRWYQLQEKIASGNSTLQQLLQFVKQVLQTDSKIRKRTSAVYHQQQNQNQNQMSDESTSMGLLPPNDQKVSSRSTIEFQHKGGLSDMHALRFSDYDDQGTPLTKGIADELLYDESFEIRHG